MTFDEPKNWTSKLDSKIEGTVLVSPEQMNFSGDNKSTNILPNNGSCRELLTLKLAGLFGEFSGADDRPIESAIGYSWICYLPLAIVLFIRNNWRKLTIYAVLSRGR